MKLLAKVSEVLLRDFVRKWIHLIDLIERVVIEFREMQKKSIMV
jgi:hypothetical protein